MIGIRRITTVKNALWENHNLLAAALFSGILCFCLFSSASTESVYFFGFRLPSFCAFKNITGLNCPGCGLTRAVILALHGRFYESYLMHIWGIPIAALLIFEILRRFSLGIQNRPLELSRPSPWRRRISLFVFLSFLLPWIAKTATLLIVTFQ